MSELLFNPFDPAFRADPYPFYARLREAAPAYRTPFGSYVVSRYQDVAWTLRSNDFSRDVEKSAKFLPVTPVRDKRTDMRSVRSKSILNLDPPDHTRLRTIVSKAFTPTAIERLGPRVAELVDGVLDAAAERGTMELVDELAFPIPFQVICDLLDLPGDRSEEIRDWSQLITASLEPTATVDDLELAGDAADSLSAYLIPIIEGRRKNLGDDVLSGLLVAEDAGDRLTMDELVSFVFLLFVAGHETTVNLIGNGMLALLNHPAELVRWRDDPSLDTRACDELLRFDGPVQLTVRIPIVDVRYGDVEIPAGTMVNTVLGSANHDPAMFDDPDELRLDRPNANRHLSFAAGIHYCLGSSLAKLEATTAITRLIRRFPEVSRCGDVEWRDRLTIRGVSRLPLSLR